MSAHGSLTSGCSRRRGGKIRLLLRGKNLGEVRHTQVWAAAADVIQANIDAMTGPATIATTVARELVPLLDQPRQAFDSPPDAMGDQRCLIASPSI